MYFNNVDSIVYYNAQWLSRNNAPHTTLRQQMSQAVGKDIRPTEGTSITKMLEYGLSKHMDK